MPSIQNITLDDNIIQITRNGVTTALNPLIIPSTDIATVENWLNATYLPPLVNGECQIKAHVFSTNPLKATIYIANLGATIPANWWNK